MEEQSAISETKQSNRFQAGKSGNPAGKKPGARNRTLLALDAIGSASATKVLESVVAGAVRGDMMACRILLDRLWPVPKGRSVALALPPIETAADLPGAVGIVARAVGAGEITPDEGQSLVAIFEGLRRSIETADILPRLEALEAERAMPREMTDAPDE